MRLRLFNLTHKLKCEHKFIQAFMPQCIQKNQSWMYVSCVLTPRNLLSTKEYEVVALNTRSLPQKQHTGAVF